ncbi:MAG: SPOR domain-containing protein [Gammaproteobacteria bacterium]|nr:SPOR domain-containing protein [Gammaproteobacteria bacterium]
MAKDYKHRAQQRDAKPRRRNYREPWYVGIIKWMAVTALLIGFAVFLVYLKSPSLQQQAPSQLNQNQPAAGKTASTKLGAPTATTKAEPPKPPSPQFDFYTILPKKEVIVPEHELKTRTREEMVGKNKKASYVIQAGSTQNMNEADQLRAKLALMGIESKIQKAKVESVTWYRVKIGPYTQMSSVNTIMGRLQSNGMKPVITEVDH